MADYNSAFTGAQIDAAVGLANTAVQSDDLATVATTGAYADLSGKPTLGTAAATDATAYATAAQGALADSAVQPAELAEVASNSMPISNTYFVVTGEAGNGYETIGDAITAINALPTAPTFFNPVQISITTRSITVGAPITLPAHTSVVGQNCRVNVTHATGVVFICGGFNRLYGLEFVGGNASNLSACIDINDKTDISILECHLYGGPVNRMAFIQCVGANWIRINVEHCITNLFSPSGYAFVFQNTSGSGRFVDTWLNDGFFDAYELTSGFGGNIAIDGGCQDFRICRSTIRGQTAFYTGVRLGSNLERLHLWQCNLEGAPFAAQSGYDIYAPTSARIEHAFTSTKRTLLAGAVVTALTWV